MVPAPPVLVPQILDRKKVKQINGVAEVRENRDETGLGNFMPENWWLDI